MRMICVSKVIILLLYNYVNNYVNYALLYKSYVNYYFLFKRKIVIIILHYSYAIILH